MDEPLGFEEKSNKHRVCKLKKNPFMGSSIHLRLGLSVLGK